MSVTEYDLRAAAKKMENLRKAQQDHARHMQQVRLYQATSQAERAASQARSILLRGARTEADWADLRACAASLAEIRRRHPDRAPGMNEAVVLSVLEELQLEVA